MEVLVRITSQTLHPFESTPVPIIHEAGWAPEPGQILQERIKYFVLATIQTPDHHLAQSLVTVLTTLSQLNIASYQNHY
jgi:hypothetical protein